jgi:hypothetical protein
MLSAWVCARRNHTRLNPRSFNPVATENPPYCIEGRHDLLLGCGESTIAEPVLLDLFPCACEYLSIIHLIICTVGLLVTGGFGRRKNLGLTATLDHPRLVDTLRHTNNLRRDDKEPLGGWRVRESRGQHTLGRA